MFIVLKMLGAVLVVAGGGGCGWYLAYGARQRISILQELQQAILILYGDIEYAAGDLAENMERLAGRTEFFSVFFMKVSGRLGEKMGQSLCRIWKEELWALPCRTRLQKEDMDFLEELGRHLGNLDRNTQLHTLQVMQGRLEQAVEQAREEYGNRAKLFRVVGVTVGVFTAVLLL